MLRTRRHDHQVSSLDILVFTSDCSFAHTRRERQSLVHGVDLREKKTGIQSVSFLSEKPPDIEESQNERTSSPISPPTGTVMSTTCEYKPVQSTRRNSPDLEGRAEDMLGK